MSQLVLDEYLQNEKEHEPRAITKRQHYPAPAHVVRRIKELSQTLRDNLGH
jgi:hypothetical protein